MCCLQWLSKCFIEQLKVRTGTHQKLYFCTKPWKVSYLLFDRRFRIFFSRAWGGWRTRRQLFNRTVLDVVLQLRQRISPESKVGVFQLGRGAGVCLEVNGGAVQRREDVVHHAALAGVSVKKNHSSFQICLQIRTPNYVFEMLNWVKNIRIKAKRTLSCRSVLKC